MFPRKYMFKIEVNPQSGTKSSSELWIALLGALKKPDSSLIPFWLL